MERVKSLLLFIFVTFVIFGIGTIILLLVFNDVQKPIKWMSHKETIEVEKVPKPEEQQTIVVPKIPKEEVPEVEEKVVEVEKEIPSQPPAVKPEEEIPSQPPAVKPEEEIPSQPPVAKPEKETPSQPPVAKPEKETPGQPTAVEPEKEIPSQPPQETEEVIQPTVVQPPAEISAQLPKEITSRVPPEKEVTKCLVNTDKGAVKGLLKVFETNEEKEYCSYQGIPYAQPPVGPLRFKDPQPIEKWDVTLDAFLEGNVCPQKMKFSRRQSKIIGNEDCLFLNVYTTTKPGTDKNLKPVMVWVHGGFFQIGSGNSDLYGPDFIIDKDVVLVTFNYRLGALGFLSMQNKDIPGNAGLKDQIMAFNWVKTNIDKFGGDPNNITAFGEDAGAASIQILMNSPTAFKNELFHKIILQSGSVLNPWTFEDEPQDRAFSLGWVVNYKGTDNKMLVTILRRISPDAIVNMQDYVLTADDIDNMHMFAFVPSMEIEDVIPNPVITEDPIMNFTPKNKVTMPCIVGMNNAESTISLLYYPELFREGIFDDLNDEPDFMLPEILKSVIDDGDMLNKLKKAIRYRFFPDKEISWSEFPQFMDLLTDMTVGLGTYLTIEFMKSIHSPYIYTYEFEYNGGLNYYSDQIKNKLDELTKKQTASIEYEKKKADTNENKQANLDKRKVQLNFEHPIKFPAATHGDELGYLFYSNKYNKQVSPESKDNQIRSQLVTLWTNFAKTGNPNAGNIDVKWNSTSFEHPTHLEIGEKIKSVDSDVNHERYKFWKQLMTAVILQDSYGRQQPPK